MYKIKKQINQSCMTKVTSLTHYAITQITSTNKRFKSTGNK